MNCWVNVNHMFEDVLYQGHLIAELYVPALVNTIGKVEIHEQIII